MPRPEKVQAVEEIRQKLTEARATFITEYRGLTVSEQQALRAALREADGEYKVVKMSLARRAADAEGLGSLDEILVGPTALAFAAADPVPVAKALRDFANDHEHLIVKGGVLAGEILPPEKVAKLADIEPREILLSRIAGVFEAPMVKLAGLLQALPRNAASMFSQLLDKKEEAGETPVEETTAPVEETVEAPGAETEPEEAVAEATAAEEAAPEPEPEAETTEPAVETDGEPDEGADTEAEEE